MEVRGVEGGGGLIHNKEAQRRETHVSIRTEVACVCFSWNIFISVVHVLGK